MILSDTAIKRPVFTTMIILAIVVFGLVSYRGIGIDLFPRVEFPVITVVSVLPGADPETVETTVTDPIEEAVSSVAGIKHLRSTSSDSVSQVIIEFELEKDVDVAYQEVTAKIATVKSELPTDLEDPIVEKFDIDSAPILAVIVAGGGGNPLPPSPPPGSGLSGEMPIRELTRVADKVVKQRLQRVANVAQVKIVGGRERTMWILLDRQKLEGRGLSVQDVEDALRREHVEAPGGRVETGPLEYVVKTKAEMATAEGFAEMIVAYRGDAPIRLRDVGRVDDGLEEERSLARLDDRRAVGLLVRRQSGTNTVAVAHAVKAEVAKLSEELKARGVRLEIAQDLSVFIEHSVDEVKFHMAFGGGLAIAIVFVFLRNLRSTLISSLVIPTAVIGTFILMAALGFTQNMMTLLALSLAIGLLIDDAIVVQENIMRHVEEGMTPKEAAHYATSEIALAVFATTMSVVAVFVPVAFMKGIVGRFFYQFGLTVAFAVMISMFVSFTLDPMLSSRILRKPQPGRLNAAFEKVFGALDAVYERVLAGALRHRLIVMVTAIGAFLGAGYVSKYLRAEFVPLEDQSEFNVRVKGPLGASLETTNAIIEQIRGTIAKEPWVAYTFATIGADELQRVNEGVMYVKMTALEKRRDMGQMRAMALVREKVKAIPDARISVEIVPRVSGGGARYADVQLEIRGSDLAVLEKAGQDIIAKMRAAGGYADIDTSYETGKPEVNVYIDRGHAADLGVSPLAVASAVRTLVGGDDVAKFRAEGDRYDVSVRLLEPYRDRPDQLGLLTVRSKSGALIPLDNVARVKKEAGPVQINRYGRTRQITILANLDRSRKLLGQATEEMGRFAREAALPAGYTTGFVGMADTMKESFGYLIFALGLAVVMVYMVLASQFESFVHPFTIMLSLPLSLVGALGALVAMNMSMSIYTMIGIIMLMGLVTKNAILLVEFTNTLRERDGLERDAAILKAGPTRLRPILMTTLAMIFGMAPIAFGTGAGSESRGPMAMAVIGGLATSTLLTLLVVPVVYTLFDDLGHPGSWRIWRLLRRK